MSTPAPQKDKTERAPAQGRLARQVVFWALAAGALVLFLYIFSSILLPFLAGMVLAYFLDPVADRLQRFGLPRLAATIVILVAFLIVLVLVLMVVIPILSNQLTEFAARLPEYLAQLQVLISQLDPGWFEETVGMSDQTLQEGLTTLFTQGTGFIATLFKSIWSSGLTLLNFVSLFVITPVVAFYMLLDWDRMIAKVDSWVPRDHLETVRQIARDINASTAGFVRGQGTLCLILGAYYAIGLTLLGLNFGLLIGFFAGLISFIPFVGSLVGLALSLGVAFVQFWPEWYWVAAVAAVFFSGQFIEGNILQPWLIGRSVDLHPVWLMFSLFAFGYLFGFVGLLIAVPAAAAIAVLVRFALSRYLASPLYSGTEPPRVHGGKGSSDA